MTSIRRWSAAEVKALRDASRLSKTHFASKLGVTLRSIANWENGAPIAPFSQSLLDQYLETAPDEVTTRFHALLNDAGTMAAGHRPLAPLPATELAAPTLDSTAYEVSGDHLGATVDAAADDALAQSAHTSAGLDGQSVADLFDQLADVARGYANRHRWETFQRARRGRDLVNELAARTRRPTDLIDVYLLASMSNALMAAAALDLSRWSAAASLARAARTFADLSGNTSAVGWARGLLATVMNWHARPDAAVLEIEGALAACPNRAAQYRLYCIAARAHALRGDRASARDALKRAAHQRPDEGRERDLLDDEIGGEFRFDPARASACTGAVWLHLRDGAAAEQALSGALAAYAAMPARDRPAAPVHGAQADLAAARLLRHDLDAAADALVPVFDVPPEQRISVLSGRLGGVRDLLRDEQWGKTPRARAVSERIDDWMTSAQALPGRRR